MLTDPDNAAFALSSLVPRLRGRLVAHVFLRLADHATSNCQTAKTPYF
jgi:hypothetical protein